MTAAPREPAKIQQIAKDQQPAMLRFHGVHELAEPHFTALKGEGVTRARGRQA